MNTLPILVRREFWEHRALWLAPLAVAAFWLLLAAGGRFSVDLPPEAFQRELGPGAQQALFAAAHLALPAFFFSVTALVLFFYLLECLNGERRDRSILFWKSLPVSDAATVLSKLAVALLVVPLGVYLLGVVTDLLATALFWVGSTLVTERLLIWDTGLWLRIQGLILTGVILGALWYAPIAAWLLVLSAWARRNVFLWAVLPPFVVAFIERRLFGTQYFAELLQHRLFGLWSELGSRSGFAALRAADGDSLAAAGALVDPGGIVAVLTSADLWLGLLVAAGLLYLAIRIRRYRDET